MTPGSTAGFVLTGGGSKRMGSDKALLPFRKTTLLENVAAAVQSAAGSVTLVGHPARYAGLGYPVLADARPGFGPVAGIAAALAATTADWNLIVACDMPLITPAFLQDLLAAAAGCGRIALIPMAEGRLHPLCAAYHWRALPVFDDALQQGIATVRAVTARLEASIWPAADPAVLTNVNTPKDWAHATR